MTPCDAAAVVTPRLELPVAQILIVGGPDAGHMWPNTWPLLDPTSITVALYSACQNPTEPPLNWP